jgi:hypothetical protein
MTTLSIKQRTELGRQAQLVIDARKRFRDHDFGSSNYDVSTSAASKVSWDRRQAALIDYRKAREDFLFDRIAMAFGQARADEARKKLAAHYAAERQAYHKWQGARDDSGRFYEEQAQYHATFADMVKYKKELTAIANSGLRREIPAYLRMAVFMRDGFIDRYTGDRLTFPGTLYLRCCDRKSFHPTRYRRKYPSIDHVVAVTNGGANIIDNYLSVSLRTNTIKNNKALGELGWIVQPPGDLADWDGETSWFVGQVKAHNRLLRNTRIARWFALILRPA